MAVLKNLVMRGASQRLGGMVLYQLKGQTLARELAPAVSNPRTPAQMDNRVRLQNVVSVYRSNRAWMAGAFENKKERESDYNAFISANLSGSQVAFTKAQAAAGAAVAAPYQISSGSLGSIEQQLQESELQTNIFLGDFAITPQTIVSEFAAAVINNNNAISEGMQLSLILNVQQVNQATGIPYIITRAYEVVLDLASSELLSTFFPAGILGNGGGTDNILYADLSDYGSGAASFILSYTTAATTRVSEQSLVMYGSLEVYNSYTSAAAIAEAVASYGENRVNFLDSTYAGSGSVVPVAQGIEAMVYTGLLVRPNGELRAYISQNTPFYVYMLQMVPEGVTPVITLTNLTASEALLVNETTMPVSRQQLVFRLSNNYTVSELSNMRLTVTLGSEQYVMLWKLGPAD